MVYTRVQGDISVINMEQNPRIIGNHRYLPSSTRPTPNGYPFMSLGDNGYMDSCSISSNDTESRTVDSGVSLSTQNSQQRIMYNGYSGGPSSPSQPPKSDMWQHQHSQPHYPHHSHHYSPQQPQITQQQQFHQNPRICHSSSSMQSPCFTSSPSQASSMNSSNSSVTVPLPQRLCHNPLYGEQHTMEAIAAAAAANQANSLNSASPTACMSSNGKMSSVMGSKHSRNAAPPPPPPYTAYHNVLHVNTPPSVAFPSNSLSNGVALSSKQSVETQTDEPVHQLPTSAAATMSAAKLLRMNSGATGSLERGTGNNSSTDSVSRRSTLTREGDQELSATKEMTDAVLHTLTHLSRQLHRGLTLNGSGSGSNSGTHSSLGGSSDVMSTDSMPVQRVPPRSCPGVCKVCHQKIVSVEDACSAMGNIYHNNCFTCCCCGKTLRGKIFYNDHGKIYCEEDYMYCGFQHTAEKCEACGHIITDMILNALGKSFHPGCFRCSVCKKCLDGVPFTVDMANKVYCIQDYHRVYAPKCASCALPIIPIEGSDEVVRVVAMDKDFHIDCYKCEDCKLQLTDEQDRRCYPLTGADGSLHLLCHSCHLNRYTRLTSSLASRSPLTGRSSSSCASSSTPSAKHLLHSAGGSPYHLSGVGDTSSPSSSQTQTLTSASLSQTAEHLQYLHHHHHHQSASQSKYQQPPPPPPHRQ